MFSSHVEVQFFADARSLWIPVGLAGVDPNAVGTPFFKPAIFEFGGINTLFGEVQWVGGVVGLGPRRLGPAVLASAPSLPCISTSGRAMNLDTTPLVRGAQEYFIGNPGILKRPTLLLSHVGNPAINQRFDVVPATLLASAIPPTLQLTVSSAGPVLNAFTGPAGVNVELVPTYFKVATEGVLDALPASMGVVTKFQAAPATVGGLPDEARAVLPTPGSDVGALDDSPINVDSRFLRFQVEFDIDKTGAGISPGTPMRPENPIFELGAWSGTWLTTLCANTARVPVGAAGLEVTTARATTAVRRAFECWPAGLQRSVTDPPMWSPLRFPEAGRGFREAQGAPPPRTPNLPTPGMHQSQTQVRNG